MQRVRGCKNLKATIPFQHPFLKKTKKIGVCPGGEDRPSLSVGPLCGLSLSATRRQSRYAHVPCCLNPIGSCASWPGRFLTSCVCVIVENTSIMRTRLPWASRWGAGDGSWDAVVIARRGWASRMYDDPAARFIVDLAGCAGWLYPCLHRIVFRGCVPQC